MQATDHEYYRKRESDERAAAERADEPAKRAHLDLADLYAARHRGEESNRTAASS